jgi:hypothetical protein
VITPIDMNSIGPHPFQREGSKSNLNCLSA